MTYEEYKEKLRECVQKEVGQEVEVVFTTQIKCNDIKREGITFKAADTKVAPIIYLDELYQEYEISNRMEEGVELIMDIYSNIEPIKEQEFPLKWDSIKSMVQIRLLKKEWNQDYLKSLVYKEWLDFAVVLMIDFPAREETNAMMTISKDMLEKLQINEEELWDAAIENFKKEEFLIDSLESFLFCATEQDPEDAVLFVMSNRNIEYGARGMLRKDILKDMAENSGRNLFILPSSQHEILILKDTGDYEIRGLKDMVRSVNEDSKVIAKKDVLSDSVYYYDYKQDMVRIAA